MVTFITIFKKYSIFATLLFLTLLILPLLTNASPHGVQEILVTISLFLRDIIIPILFSIAFLFFIINIVRYFILESANEESRKKAKSSAGYGIGAFVFLLTLWSLIAILIQGIGIESGESLCPDYLQGICDTISSPGVTVGIFPGSTIGGGSGGGTGGGGGGGTEGSGGGTGGGNNNLNFSGSSELIFGTGKDNTAFVTYTGEPRARYGVPILAQNASCISGVNTLLLANTIETSQAGYILYKNIYGATRWENITDLHAKNHLSYDADVISHLIQAGATDIHIINTHPDVRSEDFGLNILDGHGPSAADMRAICAIDYTNITFVTIDWRGVWKMTRQNDTCPYTPSDINILPIIETYLTLATLDPADRKRELEQYLRVSITPNQYKEYFSNLDLNTLDSLTKEEILALSNVHQANVNISIEHIHRITNQQNQSADIFCDTF